MHSIVLYICMALLLIGCQPPDDTLPTIAVPGEAATRAIQTQNAPPEGYTTISLPRIDDNLTRLPGWRYDMSLSFEGVFARTTRDVQARTEASVWYNQVASARRVIATVNNGLEEDFTPTQYEAVRLGPDAFLVRDGSCLANAADDAQVAADLSAATLLGGVQQATVTIDKQIINGEQVWRYDFSPDDLILPNVGLNGESARINSMRGELWFAPQHDAVIRYYLTLDVENVSVFQSTLPVTGQAIFRYDLFDIGTVPNLNVPYGC